MAPWTRVLVTALGAASLMPRWSSAHRDGSAADSMSGPDVVSSEHHNRQVKASGNCVEMAPSKGFCANDPQQMAVIYNMHRMGAKNGIRAVSILRYDRDTCTAFHSVSSDLQVAESDVMECCKNRDPGGDCHLLGPTYKDSVSTWCTYARAREEEGSCQCRPNAIPRMINGNIQWPSSNPIPFDPKASFATCVDVCFAKSVESASARMKETPLRQKHWPVVMLAVYALGFGIVHSNPVFCPNTEFLRNLPPESCFHPNKEGKCGNDVHETLLAKGHDVPLLLQRLGCRELIYDGNGGGGTWIPLPTETGCWAQGRSSEQEFRKSLKLRDDSYAELYWLTSENTVSPFSMAGGQTVQGAMESCFGINGYRLDFNPGSYSLLHHNCNKFSTEVMKFLGLPKFYPPNQKGSHSKITFSATREESGMRRFFGALTDIFFDPRAHRPLVSQKCHVLFYTKEPNCRRVEGAKYGDCPRTSSNQVMECYALGDKTGLAESVKHTGAANGVCRIPEGGTCEYTAAKVVLHQPQCMFGLTCKGGKCAK